MSISDGSEEEKSTKKKPKKRVIEDSSDEDKPKSKSKKPAKKEEVKRKEIDVKDLKNLFGGPVKRVERHKDVKLSPPNDLEMVIDLDTPVKSNGHQKSPMKSDEHPKSPEKKSSPDKTKLVSPEKVSQSSDKTSSKTKVSSKKVLEKVKPPVKPKESPKKATKSPAKLKDTSSEWQTTVKSLKLASDAAKPSTSLKVQDKPAPIKPMTPIKRDIQAVDVNTLSFVDKYKPKTVKDIIGQQGAGSNANKLQNWLLHWHKNHGDPKKKVPKHNPYAKNDDGSSFKAALLSGQPGIGKTTTAHLVCNELCFDVVEFNASDTRSKRALKEEVQQLLTNQSLHGYANGESKGTSKRHVLIMDEVDGMAGNEDRGGIAELILLIKESHIPVICMCNDRANPKMRSLSNHCFDLKFYKPSINQMRSAMMSVCFKEGIKVEPGAVDAIISGTGNDVRQTLNHLALYSATKDNKIGADKAKRTAQICEKDVKIVS